jgi:excisionase family DNA binding protein
MSREIFTLEQAAAHVHLPANELRHVAQRGEIEAHRAGDEWRFEHRALDEWAQRNLLSSSRRELAAQHRVMMDEERRARRADAGVASLFREEAIDLSLQAKAKAGLIRDMASLGARSGLVYDPDGLYRELVERETIASTAIGEGAAFLHPRFHDPYLFEEAFLGYGRSVKPLFFGAPDGAATSHYFLICSTDHERHLHVLARLAMLAHGTDLLERLSLAAEPREVVEAVRACEEELLR